MSNVNISKIPEVREYLLRKESNLRSKYFKKYRFMKHELALVMLFQSEAMKHIRKSFGVTNTDFKVLSASRLHKVSHKASFRPYHLRIYLPGMWLGQLYKSFRRLERLGLITSYKDVGFKTYVISDKGDSCLKSYAKVFDEIFYSRIQGLE